MAGDFYLNGEWHNIYPSLYRGGNNYGFSPPDDPDPIGYCEWCDEDIYNEDHIIDGDIVCPACAEYWNSHEIAVDFIKRFFGSMPQLAQECKWDAWMEQFAEYMRECEPGLLKQVLKKDETPCCNTTPHKKGY